MNSSATRTQSTSRHSSSAALRPRTKRYITGLEDLSDEYNGDASAAGSIAATPYDTPHESRLPSPNPSRHPSRNTSRNRISRNSSYAGGFGESSDLASSLSGFWGKSWTNLQGLASNVLGSDITAEPIKDKISVRTKKTFDVIGSKAWGPPSREMNQPGAGTKEARKDLVIAKKREALLKRGESDAYLDIANARYKRRTSDDFESISAPPAQAEERDALVYLHHVVPTDTLPGISIKFNCPLPTIKKANRLWSNDVIHSRKVLVVPVEACNVKGRRVAGPDQKGKDYLSDPDEYSDRRSSSSATITPSTLADAPPDSEDATSTSATQKPSEDNPWTHDSWILLENAVTATEIARMSRQDLGFFPRARRKSVSYSDLDTPSASFDLPRPSITVSDMSTPSERTTLHKSRRSSSSHAFAPKMMGPGGVGTLVGKGPSAPGPGEDKLSKAFQRALPKFAPQPVFDETAELQLPNSGTSSPLYNYNIENFGSAIEGWVRKLADKAAKVVEPPSPNVQKGRETGIHGGTGDLIELEDSFDLNLDDGDEDALPDPAAFEDEPLRGRGHRRTTSSAVDDQQKGLTARNLASYARKKGD